jgi:uncharacterized protein YqgC (DUF456 family)
MRLARETWVLVTICIADLVTTIYFVEKMGGSEGNPLMDFYLKLGIPAFVLAKMLLLVSPLVILEFARRHRPQFTQRAMQVAVALYLGLYGVVVFRLNGSEQISPMMAAQIENIERWAERAPQPGEMEAIRTGMASF